MHTLQLTLSQHSVLAYAIHNTSGKIEWFPVNIKGGARKKVIDSLFRLALVTTDGSNWFVSSEGYDAMGTSRLKPDGAQETAAVPCIEDRAWETDVAAGESALAKDKAQVQGQVQDQAEPRTRGRSKQAEVIEMLKRPEGATLAQICEATGWQAHTVRGTFAGALKKKLGLTIVSEKIEGSAGTPGAGQRLYRIAEESMVEDGWHDAVGAAAAGDLNRQASKARRSR